VDLVEEKEVISGFTLPWQLAAFLVTCRAALPGAV